LHEPSITDLEQQGAGTKLLKYLKAEAWWIPSGKLFSHMVF